MSKYYKLLLCLLTDRKIVVYVPGFIQSKKVLAFGHVGPGISVFTDS